MCYCFTTLQFTNFWIAHNKRNYFHKAKMILIQILLANSKILHSLQVTGCSFSRLLSSANGRNITTSSKMQIDDAFISCFSLLLDLRIFSLFFLTEMKSFFLDVHLLVQSVFPQSVLLFFLRVFCNMDYKNINHWFDGIFHEGPTCSGKRRLRIFFFDH